MKILLVSGVYPPLIGGPSAQTRQIAQRLMARGIEAHVVTYGDQGASGMIDGVPVTFIDNSRRPGFINKLVRNMNVYRELARIMDEQRPSVIHMQTAAGPLALLTGVAGRRRRIPTLIKYGADLTVEMINRDQVKYVSAAGRSVGRRLYMSGLELTERFLFSVYDCVWATTSVFEKRLLNQFHVPLRKILLRPNFIDTQPFKAIAFDPNRSDGEGESASLPSQVTLLTVARLHPMKGVDVCIEAIPHLADLPVQLRIVGSGSLEYESYLQDLAKRLGVSDRVKFIGAVSHDRVVEQYRETDIFILASYYEAFAITLIEAMAAGNPVIATDVGGTRMVVEDGVSARLVPPGDAQGLASAIRFIVANKEVCASMSVAGRTRARQFDLQSGVDSLVETYKRLSSSTGARVSTEPSRAAAGINYSCEE